MIIEFVEPPRPPRAAWVVVGGLWVVVAVLAGLNVVLQARVTRLQDARRAAEDLARAQVAAPTPRVVPPWEDDAREALKRAALPEAAAFTELENVAMVGIRLTSIDDNPSVSTVTVELEATSDAVLADYVDQLNAGMPAPRWHIRQVAATEMRATDLPSHSGVESAGTEYTRRATIYRDF